MDRVDLRYQQPCFQGHGNKIEKSMLQSGYRPRPLGETVVEKFNSFRYLQIASPPNLYFTKYVDITIFRQIRKEKVFLKPTIFSSKSLKRKKKQ